NPGARRAHRRGPGLDAGRFGRARAGRRLTAVRWCVVSVLGAAVSLLLAPALLPAAETYDLNGRISPAAVATISLYRVASPFTSSTLSDEEGRFRFRKLEPGAYTVAVFEPARGEARQTYEIGP